MIFNLFSYPSNFGKVELYKCDYFGNGITVGVSQPWLAQKDRNNTPIPRIALVDKFSVDVSVASQDNLSFGGFNQQSHFSFENRQISIDVNFLFANSLIGCLDPAIDLLLNVSAWAFQGTSTSYKFTHNPGNSPPVNETLMYQALFNPEPPASAPKFLYFLTNGYNVVGLQSFPTDQEWLNGYWLEVFIYGSSTDPTYPIFNEPMFRMDTSEGSFYPCMVDSINFTIQEDYIKLGCKIVAINYDASTRFNFINSSQRKFEFLPIIPLHKSRIKISDYVNDVQSDFNITDLKTLDQLSGLFTQSFIPTPIKEISINIQNNLNPFYGNNYEKMPRRFVKGYYSQSRKVNGKMSVLALRSSQPTFNKYPALTGVNNKSLQIYFGNQVLNIPYTIWQPTKINNDQGSFVSLDFDWFAITRVRNGQPIFEMEGEYD